MKSSRKKKIILSRTKEFTKHVKKNYYILLLILFICGLNSSSANGQDNDGQLAGDIPPGSIYKYDSSEVTEIARIILENEMLRENEVLYKGKDSLFSINKNLMEGKITSLQEIIKLKDLQLIKLEQTPIQIIDKSWKWWQYFIAAVGAVTFGFTAGVIYENVR
jgi:hypothetical protein